MWVRRAAIRPVPSFAQVPEPVLSRVEAELSEDGDEAKAGLDDAFGRFESAQPILSSRISEALGKPIDETALALGYFLTLSVWLSFDRAFGGHLAEVGEVELESVEEALALDEQIRLADPAEVVDSDDVIAMEQPHVLSFINEHLEAALEANADTVDVDEVHAIYRLVLIEVLALSYAVKPPSPLAQAASNEFSA